MRTLTLDYVLMGERRGYTFTTPTDDLAPEIVKALWRSAMPRGANWDDPALVGARALKSFALHTGEIALCEVVVTDRRDEVGRAGIRTATIHILTLREQQAMLARRLAEMPAALVANAEAKLTSREWALMFRKRRTQQPPTSLVKPQTILAYPYDPAGWRFVETCILLLATRATLLANLIEVSPTVNPFADRALSFTTLALDSRDETRLIAVPLARARTLDDLPYIDIT
ncbi:MAG: hypothetical protein SGI73_14160 [Chloroflexota bacterium]|nr:hypothetical protein [Chloroflexota bacterium]